MDSETKTMNTEELSQAVSLLLEREEARAKEQRRKGRRQKRQRRKELEAGVAKLAQSIEVIKWCIMGIASVMAIALIILVLVVMEVEREAERIKTEVQGIQRDAEMIRDKIRHPLESLGGALGRKVENEIGGFLGGGDSNE